MGTRLGVVGEGIEDRVDRMGIKGMVNNRVGEILMVDMEAGEIRTVVEEEEEGTGTAGEEEEGTEAETIVDHHLSSSITSLRTARNRRLRTDLSRAGCRLTLRRLNRMVKEGRHHLLTVDMEGTGDTEVRDRGKVSRDIKAGTRHQVMEGIKEEVEEGKISDDIDFRRLVAGPCFFSHLVRLSQVQPSMLLAFRCES